MVWVEWFNAAVEGANSFGLPEKVADKLDRRIALGDNGREGFWERQTEAINAVIAGWVAEVRRNAETSNKPERQELIPDAKPASVRPRWHNEILENVTEATSDLARDVVLAMVAAVRADLRELFRDTENEANIDPRARGLLRGTASLIPSGKPNLPGLFRLSRKAQLLVDYIPSVNAEWQSIHAAGYRFVSIQLGKVLDQFDELKAFSRNAGLAEIGSDDATQIAKGIREVAKELSSPKAKRFVAPSIGDGLRKLADEVDNRHEKTATANLVQSEKTQQV